MSSRVIVFVCLLLTVLLPTGSLEAQQQKKVFRLGYLSASDPSGESVRSEPIRLALRKLGYVEGQNIIIEYRYAEGKLDRLTELAADLVRVKVDLIVAAGGYPGIRAAKDATKTIPVVMIGLGLDPVGAGFVESLARPGGNITGITNRTRELTGKRLGLFKEAVPKIVSVAVLYDPASRFDALDVKEAIPDAARALKLTVYPREVRGADDFERVFAALNKERPDGLYLATSPLIFSNGKRIAALALKRSLPAVYLRKEDVEAGGLMYYGADLTDINRRVVTYVDKILKGAKPADLPVEQPTKFELVINLKTAKQIGLSIPPNVLARADRVIR